MQRLRGRTVGLRIRGRATLAGAILAMAIVPAALAASEPVQNLSEAGQDAYNPQIAIDSANRATITWYRYDGSKFRIQSVRLAADGTPGTIQTLSDAGQSAFGPQIAIDSADRATITWRRSDGSGDRIIQSVRLAADGTPGTVQALSEAGQDAGSPQIAIDSADRATITWQRFDGSNDRIQSVRLAADGTPGTVQTLSEAGQDADSPQITTDSTGRATITWQRFDGSNDRIQSVRLAADGTPGTVQTLSEAGQDAFGFQIAIDSADRATITWHRYDSSKNRIQSVRLAADGTPGTVQTLSEAGEHAHRPQIAIDSADLATITWRRYDGSKDRIQSVRLAADGTPGTVQTLSDAGQNANDPQIAIDSADRATITWRRSDGSKYRIQSVRLAAGGTPGTVQTHSEAGQDAFRPQIATDSTGRATITWYRFDGSNDRIQSARVDLDPPPVAIDSPAEGTKIADSSSASPTFSSDDPSATFLCRIDAVGSFAPCTSPKTYAGLSDGAHAFRVRAVDAAGNTSPIATRLFTVSFERCNAAEAAHSSAKANKAVKKQKFKKAKKNLKRAKKKLGKAKDSGTASEIRKAKRAVEVAKKKLTKAKKRLTRAKRALGAAESEMSAAC